MRPAALLAVVGVTSLAVIMPTNAFALVAPVAPVPLPSSVLASLGFGGSDAAAAAAGATAAGGEVAGTSTILAGAAAFAPETLGVSLAVGAVAAGGIYVYSQMSPGFDPDSDVTNSNGPFETSAGWEWGHSLGPVDVTAHNTSTTTPYRVKVTESCSPSLTYVLGPIDVAAGAYVGTSYACSYPQSDGSNLWLATSFAVPHVTYEAVPGSGVFVNFGGGASPNRTLRTDLHCVEFGGGSATTTVSTSSAVFHEAASSSSPHAAVGVCPAGMAPDGLGVVETGVGVPDKLLGHVDPNGPLGDFYVAHPGCGTEACALILYKVGASTSLVSCFSNPTLCTDWATDVNRDLDYQCKIGADPVALDECTVYQRYWTDTGTATWTDPSTPLPTLTGGGPVPAPSPSDGCTVDTSLAGLLTGNVFVSGLKCVLKWAFIPSGGFTPYTGTVTRAFNGSFVGQIAGTLGGFVAPIIGLGGVGSSGCEGPELDWSYNASAGVGQAAKTYHLMDHWHPWSACGPVAAYVSAFWIPLASFVTYWGAFLACLRLAGSAIGLSEVFTDGEQDLSSAGGDGNYAERAWKGAVGNRAIKRSAHQRRNWGGA